MLLGYTEDEEFLTGLVKVYLEIQCVSCLKRPPLSLSVFLTFTSLACCEDYKKLYTCKGQAEALCMVDAPLRVIEKKISCEQDLRSETRGTLFYIHREDDLPRRLLWEGGILIMTRYLLLLSSPVTRILLAGLSFSPSPDF